MTPPTPRTGPATANRLRARRRSFLFSCALGTSLILVAHPEGARAQAVNASPTTQAGSVTYSRFDTSAPTPGSETVTIQTPTAIINWTPNSTPPPGTPFIFLPNGNILTFQNGLNTADFVVLNRILTAEPSRFDGTVLGRLRDGAGNVTGPGGTILFSSPGGIIVGSTAVFDVGNLVLTSLNVVDDGYGTFVQPGGGFAFDGGAANPDAAIVTEAGAQIVATAENSYVAMVAPRIVHAGSTRVNGSIAYIAAEAASFTVNAGLFDIVVDTGSDNATPIEHSGTSGGPASSGAGDNHGIYMVAVPKNQAITMLLEGSVGFDAATDASIENGVIVLSAGYNVFGGAVDTDNPAPGEANIDISQGSFSSDVFAFATNDAFAGGGTGALDFLQDVSLVGRQRARLFAGPGQAVTVGGDALVSAARTDTDNPATGDVVGGEALAFAQSGGTLSVAGNLTVDASAVGEEGDGNLGDGTGGTASVFADGGQVVVSGDLNVLANGSGAAAIFKYNDAGSGFGGTASVEATGGGSVVVSGSMNIFANGLGGESVDSSGRPGDGTGGTASLVADGGSVAVSGDASLVAIGAGGGAFTYSSYSGSYYGATGANGTGGNVVITAAAGGSIDIAGTASLNVAGVGGDGIAGVGGGTGGTGQGGTITIDVTDAEVTIDVLDIFAGGIGGDGGDGETGYGSDGTAGGDGGAGTGGTVVVDVGVGGILTVADLAADAVGLGGAGGDGSFGLVLGGSGGTGGTGTGGFIEVRTSGGTLDVTSPASILISAIGVGGDGGDGGANSVDFAGGGAGGAGGAAVGGNARLIALGGAINGGAAFLSADAFGGVGGQGGDGPIAFGGAGGRGGNASSGEARITSLGGDITLGDVVVTANALAGGGGSGGAGSGGRGNGGDGGDAVAGSDPAGFTRGAYVVANGGNVTVGAAAIQAIGAGGAGGQGGNGGAGGNGTGGAAQFVALAGTLQALDLVSISTKGLGGAGGSALANGAIGGNGGAGGVGTGGFSLISAEAGDSAVLIAADVELFADGQGGDGGDGAFGTSEGGDGGAGGAGTGGTAEIFAGTGSATTGNASLRANGTGGAGGDGGAGGTIDPPSGTGGDGGAGGVGTGGATIVVATDGDATIGDVDLVANGLGGLGGLGGSAATPGASGADAGSGGGFVQIGANGSGSLGAGNVTVTVEGDSGGSINIFAIGAPATFASLDVFGRGIDFNATFADNATLRVDGAASFDIDADLFVYTTATGLIDVGGAMTLLTPGSVIHDQNPGGAARTSFIRAGSYEANAGIDYRAADATIESADFITVLASGAVTAGTLDAGGAIEIDGASIDLAFATSGGDIDLAATGDIVVGTANAGDDFLANAGGAFTGGTVTANIGSDIIITSVDDLRLDNGAASGLIDLTSTAGSVLSAGLLDAGTDLNVLAAVDVALTNVVAGNDILLEAPDGAVSLVSGSAGNDLNIFALVSIDADTLAAGNAMDIQTLIGDGNPATPRTVTIGSATAGNLLNIGTFGALVADSLTVTNAGGLLFAGSSTSIDVGTMSSGGDVELLLTPTSPSGFTVADARGGIAVDLITAAGNVTATNLASGIDFGTVNAGGSITVTTSDPDPAFGGFAFDGMTAGGGIFVAASGDVGGGDLLAGQDIEIETAGTLTLVSAESTDGEIELDAIGSIVAGTLRSGLSTTIESVGGDIEVTLAQANLSNAAIDGIQGFGALAENGNITVGDVTAQNIGLAAGGDINANTLTAVEAVFLFAGGDIALGSVDAGGLFYIGNPSTLDVFDDFDDFDPLVFAGLPQLPSGGSLTISGTAQAGQISLAVGQTADISALLAAANIFVGAGGNLRVDNATAGGSIELVSAGGDVLSGMPGSGPVGSLSAGADLIIDAAGEIVIGDGQAGGSIVLTAGEDVTARDLDAVQNVQITAGDDITFRNLTAQLGDVILALGGNLVGTGNLSVGSSLDVTIEGDMSFDRIAVGEDIRLTSNGGSILIGDGTAGRDIILRALVGIEAETLFAGRDVDIQTLVGDGDPATPRTVTVGTVEAVRNLYIGTFGALVADRLITSGPGTMFAGSSTSIRIGTMDAAGDVELFMAPTSPSGFTIADGRGGIEVEEISAAGNINAFNASSGIVFGSADAGGSITVTTTDSDPDFAGFTAGDLDAGGDIMIDITGTATFQGTVSAPNIMVTSLDIDITEDGQLGDGDAIDNVFLTARDGGGQTVIGGDQQGPGYTLTQAEFDRIAAAVLTVEALRNGEGAGPDMLVRDLALDAGRIRQLELITAGILQVQGGLLLANAGAQNGIGITATERLEIVTPTGSVRIRDAAGLPGGTLTLTSNNVWAVDADLLAQLQADPNFAGRNDALLANNGEEEPRGYIEAADVEIFARDTLFVQNTGSDTVFAGITVTGNTLRVTPTGETPLDVYAFGRRINPDGTFVTNSDFFNEVVFEEGYGAGYTETAAFNQCLIATVSCPVVIVDDPIPGNSDTIEEQVGGPDAPTIMMDLVDTSFSADPLIEEPVTSGGDSVLWDCDRDEDGDCDEDDRNE